MDFIKNQGENHRTIHTHLSFQIYQLIQKTETTIPFFYKYWINCKQYNGSHHDAPVYQKKEWQDIETQTLDLF